MPGPPAALVDSLVQGPSLISRVEWYDTCASTNAICASASAGGAAEGLLVLADEQTAGRGRHGRSWSAPPGTSLLLSLLLRPAAPYRSHGLLPLLAGAALAETVARHVPGHEVVVKWPNDVLVDERKVAGILAEGAAGAVVLGIGLNVDWRGVERPEELRGATSLAEAVSADVDRWRVLAGFLGVFSQRYDQWHQLPAAFLDGYRQRCATIGRQVRVIRLNGDVEEGEAVGVAADGALELRPADGGPVRTINEGDVEHLR